MIFLTARKIPEGAAASAAGEGHVGLEEIMRGRVAGGADGLLAIAYASPDVDRRVPSCAMQEGVVIPDNIRAARPRRIDDVLSSSYADQAQTSLFLIGNFEAVRGIVVIRPVRRE